ncbi:flagellar type III secretion system pore protein FliP [Liquorilactobacillus nagelii]|uniref:Flagellar biosynthetic protein FliP n=1 Tax=Liquorilactobacillus nagelii TaxID=82688 RepID=A0A0A7RFY0_9LACO|nr:flagellar type III secretion system pore protein FliP [Liquorilactobacillus nagelii]AJA34151.1 flagellar biosynthetic protein FliP [Liquorilactobacillus nagelii]KRL42079.1 flagellar biosynthesis protein FliP [Liquorilactobacillus nagelii DSM 13675]QYH55054.1 flagellar type III secretion system pore protein FliP [Liquorilactobacillus nagelii DSM 13675]
MKKKLTLLSISGLAALFWLLIPATPVLAISTSGISSAVNNLVGGNSGSNQIINTFLMLTLLSFIPLLLVMTTSFTRIIMVLSFTRSALGTQQNPPNQVLIGLALFLTFFIMRPVYTNIYQQAVVPYERQQITQQQAVDRSELRMKKFMYKQTREKDIQLFVEQSSTPNQHYHSYKKVPMTIITPAFILSELRTAFSIGFLIFIPFLIIDMVVSSVLMSMGMVMLPPVMISLPFKILLFVLADGWYLLVESLIQSFK